MIIHYKCEGHDDLSSHLSKKFDHMKRLNMHDNEKKISVL